MSGDQDPLFVEEEIPIRDQIARRSGVRLITGHTSPIVDSVLSPGGFKSYALVYDKRGLRILHEKFSRDGKLIRQWRYDAGGKLVQEITYEGSGNIDYRLDVVYDRNQWKEKRMYSTPDRLSYRVVADRNEDGRLLRAIYHGPTGETIRSDLYDYDRRGLLTRVEMVHMGERLYEYDASANLSRKVINLPGASAYGEAYEFQYDGRGLISRMEAVHFSVTLFDITFH